MYAPHENEKELNERRVGSAQSARDLYTQLNKDDEIRQKDYAKILNQLNGGKPFNPTKLAALGQNWRSNFNFGDAESALEQTQISYWRMVHDVSSLTECTLHIDSQHASGWEQIFQKNYDRFVDDWGDVYVNHYMQFSYNHLAFGFGACNWRNPDTPRWRAMRAGSILVPKNTKAVSSEVEMALVKDEMTIAELWRLIRTKSARSKSADLGWNVTALRKLLKEHINGNLQDPEEDPLDIHDAIQNKSESLSAQKGPIKLVHLHILDYDEKVSHMIIPRAVGTQVHEFLFDNFNSKRRKKTIQESIAFVFYSVQSGYIHGVKGFGHRNYQPSIAINRVKNRFLDATILDGLNFTDVGGGNTRDEIAIQHIGAVSIFPDNLQAIQHPSGQPRSQIALQMLETTRDTNNAQYREQSNQIQDTETATQARILASMQSQVDMASTTLYLKQLENNILNPQFVRLRRRGNPDPDAKKFKERCLADGMPEEIFHDADLTVATGADPGAASAAVRAELANEFIHLRGSRFVNERGAIEMRAQNVGGARAVKKLVIPEDGMEDLDAQNEAIIENATMGQGIALPAAPRHNHIKHIETHLEPLLGMIDQMAAGQANGAAANLSVEQVISLETVIPHVEEHFQYLREDEYMEEHYQALWPKFAELKSRAEGMIRKAEETAMQMQAEQQELAMLEQQLPPQQPMPPNGQIPEQAIPPQAPSGPAQVTA